MRLSEIREEKERIMKSRTQIISKKSFDKERSTLEINANENNDKTGTKVTINPSLLIPYLTLLGYVNGFFFEVGYKAHYHLPYKFVELNLSTILAPATLTVSMYLFMMVIIIVPSFIIYLILFWIRSKIKRKYILKKKDCVSNNDKLWTIFGMLIILIRAC
ncbi:hypothetical protein [Cohnella caldifontis]|uniref:hypothetical protein n=1 Tax=Cohnella caldifontis TaxID=3027471 RepID=UPI0023EB7437|nr:hypothetical protein [Cohnella sp. YIM B05605]